MRVTIFGAGGLLGNALLRRWSGDEIIGLSSKDTDIRDRQQVGKCLLGTQPDWVILAAAYTDVYGCETNPELAFAVNSQGAANVAHATAEQGARLVFLSTDYVFDGLKTTPYETSDARAPQSVYGRSKAEAELRIGELLPDCCIVRTSWLFGRGGKCFPDTILKLAATKPEIAVVTDQKGSPTYTYDLASAIIRLCRQQASGIIHATNAGECSWSEFAAEIVARAGLKTIIRGTTSDEFRRLAVRPKYSVLSPASLNKRDIELPSWQDALQRYIEARSD